MRFRYAVFGIMLIVLILAGCASQEKAPAASNSTLSPPTKPVKTFGINETVIAGNISFKVSAWGFVPDWGTTKPSDKGKLLWIRLASENIGSIPVTLPGSFYVSYRGINITPNPSLNWEGEYYNDRTPHNPGVVTEGYLFFDVPEGLNDGEPTFFVEMPGGVYKMSLSDGVPFSGEHVSITDAKMMAITTTMVMALNVTNDRHYYPPDYLWIRASKVNGQAFNADYENSVIPVMISNKIPFETSALKVGLPIYYNSKKMVYEDLFSQNGKLELGKPGEKINVTITVGRYQKGTDIFESLREETFIFELPLLTSNTPYDA